MHDSYIVPAAGLSGGLWLLWNDEVDLQAVHSTHFYILAKCVHKPTSMNFNLVCIYGNPHHQQTSLIWQDVSTFVLAGPDTPTFCMGDMNNIMHEQKNVVLKLLILSVSGISATLSNNVV